MSFLSRLGLTSVSATESNHGTVLVQSHEISFEPVIPSQLKQGAVDPSIVKYKIKRFVITDLGFVDSGEDYPKVLELAGSSLTSEMFIVFPGFQLWSSLDQASEMLFQLFKDDDLIRPVAMVWVMYQSGLVRDDRVVRTADHSIFFPGTYLFHADPESSEYTAEFNLFA